MAFWFGTSSGAVMGSSSLSIEEQKYSPVFDEPIDVKYLDQLLPSFYRSLMSDEEIFTSVWAGAVPALSGELLNLWHIDYAKSLIDMPVFTQRKWVKLDLVEDETFDVDPSLTIDGISGVYSIDEENDRLAATWSNKGSSDRAFKPLRGEATEKCSLSWSTEITVDSAETYAVSLTGYLSSAAHTAEGTTLRGALLSGVIATDTGLDLFALHASYAGDLTAIRSGSALSVGKTYRIDSTYTANTTRLVVSAVDPNYTKLQTSTSPTAPSSDIYTNEIKSDGYYISPPSDPFYHVTFSTVPSIKVGSVLSTSDYSTAISTHGSTAFLADRIRENSIVTEDQYLSLVESYGSSAVTATSVNFETLGVTVEDRVVYDGQEYKILSVQSDRIYLDLSLLPEGVPISYTIVGPQVVASVSSNLAADAGDNTFSVDSFGTTNLDTQNAISTILPKLGSETDGDYAARILTEKFLAAKASMVGTSTNWSYVDPTSTHGIVYLPRIQSTLKDPSHFLYSGIDYSIGAAGKLIQFHEPPPSVMYAEYVAYDEQKLYNNFGHFVGIGKDEISSESLRSKIRALFYSYFRGPTLKAIKTGVQIHLGLPIAERAGKVEAINTAYSGKYGQLIVAGKSYLYPISVGTELSVGDSVEIFQTLSEGVNVLDYVNSPTWFEYFDEEPWEVQKYHQFLIELNLDAFDVPDLSDAAAFVDVIRPTWKGAKFLAFKALEDDQDILDDILIKPTVHIYEEMWSKHHPLYSGRFFGASPFDDGSADPSVYAPLDLDYDWSFDSGLAEYDKPALAMARTAEMRTANLLWRDTTSESKFLSGEVKLYEGYNRSASLAEVDSSGDSKGVRAHFSGGSVVSEAGVVVSEPSIVTLSTVSVPSGSTATSAAQITFSGTTFTDSASDSYILTSSSGAVSDAPVFPSAVALKWSDVSNWLSDGVEGTGYSYAAVPVISIVSDTEVIVDITGVSPSGTVVAEVRKGGPTGTVLANEDLSDVDGKTSSGGLFWVEASSITITDWGGSGQPLEGLTTSVDIYHGVNVNILTEDEVYLAVRSTTSSSHTYSSEFDYSGWYVAKVVGYGTAGNEAYLHIDDEELGNAFSNTTDLEWIIWKNPDLRLTVHSQRSGNVLIPTLTGDGTQLSSLPTSGTSTESPSVISFTGAVFTKTGTYGYSIRPQTFTDSNALITRGVQRDFIVEISGAATSELDGEYAVDFVYGRTIGASDWALLQLTADETSWPSSAFPAGQIIDSAVSITIRKRPFHGISENGWTLRTDEGEYRILGVQDDPDHDYVPSALGSRLYVDHVFDSGADLGSWFAYADNPGVFVTVPFIHTDEYVSLAERWEGSGARTGLSYPDWTPPPMVLRLPYDAEYVEGRAAIVDNNYFRTYMDYFFELSPDEEVSLTLEVSPGLGDRTYSLGTWTERPLVDYYDKFFGWWSWDHDYLGGYLGAVLFTQKIGSGSSGGAPTAGPFTGNDSDAGVEYFVFEDTNGSFTTDISDVDSNDQPNNITYICLTENSVTGESLQNDWLQRVRVHGKGVHNARFIALQVIEVQSDTRLLLRYHASGEDDDSSPIESQWFGNSGHLRYFIRDLQDVDDDVYVLSSIGVWSQVTSISGTPDLFNVGWLPASSTAHGLPRGLTWGINHTDYPDDLARELRNGGPVSIDKRTQYQTYMCIHLFRGDLANGGGSITPTDQADFNKKTEDGLLTTGYYQVAPTPYTSAGTTEVGSMIADGPVFSATVSPAATAEGILQVLSIPATSFTITFDDGTSTTVSITSPPWTDVSGVVSSIVSSFAPYSSRIVVSEGSAAGTVLFKAPAPGPDGNSITLNSMGASTAIALPSSLGGGVDGTINLTDPYTGVSVTDSAIVLRSVANPFSVGGALDSVDIDSWFTQGSGDSYTFTVTERVPDDEPDS